MTLQITITELFLRVIPESFLFILASYVFSKRLIDKKRFIMASLLSGIIVFLIRRLPINFGVHSVLGLIAFIAITVGINKIETIKAISAGIISMILGFICEAINVGIIVYIFNIDINDIFFKDPDPIMKTILGIPSLLIWGCIIGTYYFILYKRKELKDV